MMPSRRSGIPYACYPSIAKAISNSMHIPAHMSILQLFCHKQTQRSSQDWLLIASRCLITAIFPSRKRSTQFCAHDSSPFSSFPLRIDPVTHFFQQMSVSEWTAISPKSKKSVHDLITLLAINFITAFEQFRGPAPDTCSKVVLEFSPNAPKLGNCGRVMI